MTEDEFFSELEAGWATRQAELLALQNLAARMEECDADRYRRAMVLMLYAHFEGGVKFSLLVYVKFLNELDIAIVDANAEIAAAGISDVMHALRDPHRKCPEFSRNCRMTPISIDSLGTESLCPCFPIFLTGSSQSTTES